MLDKVNEKKHLESISKFYSKGDRMDEFIVDREIELLKKVCDSYDDALEVGCGNGYSTEKLYELYDNYEILEPSKENIKLMNNRIVWNKHISIHEFLLEEFIPKKKYNNVFFLNVLEHVENPIKCLAKLSEIVSDEGKIYISVPNCMSLNRRAGYKMGLLESYEKFAEKDYEVGHRRLYTVDMIKEHCNLAGLKILDIKGIYLKPLSEKQMLSLGEDVVKAFYKIGEDIPEYCANLFIVATKKYY